MVETATEYVNGIGVHHTYTINGKLIRGNRAIKINAEGFHAFESFNHPHLCDVGINFQYHKHHILTPDYDKQGVRALVDDRNEKIGRKIRDNELKRRRSWGQ